MIIALDFDDTHTKDPALWNRFIDDTMRYNHEAQRVFDTVKGIERDDMFFTGRLAKRPHLAALGVHPDVWIDDNPHWVDGDIT